MSRRRTAVLAASEGLMVLIARPQREFFSLLSLLGKRFEPLHSHVIRFLPLTLLFLGYGTANEARISRRNNVNPTRS